MQRESSATPGENSKQAGKLQLNEMPIVRECLPGLFKKTLLVVFSDRALLVNKLTIFSKNWFMNEAWFSYTPNEFEKTSTSIKEVAKSDLSRVVMSILPRWLAGGKSKVAIESLSGRSVEFKIWQDQLAGLDSWSPERIFARRLGFFTVVDTVLAVVLALLMIGLLVSLPLLLLGMNSPLRLGGTDPFNAIYIITLSLLALLAIICVGCAARIVLRALSRPCWRRFDKVCSIPLIITAIVLGTLLGSQLVKRYRELSQSRYSEELFALLLPICLTFMIVAVLLYFPIRVFVGDRLVPFTTDMLLRKPRRSWRLLATPLRSNSVAWGCKILGVLGMIAYWSPLTQPIYEFVSEKVSDKASVFRIYQLLNLVLTIPPAVLLYLGYRLSQRRPRISVEDSRRPIVFLRPFNDDQTATIQPRGFLPTICGVDKGFGGYGGQASERGRINWLYLWTAVHPIRILRLLFNRCVDTAEESLVRFFSQFAPVYAIGKPGEILPTPGAIRLYPGDNWQDVVDSYLRKAQAVVIQPGVSEGVVWELNQIKSVVPHYRVLLNLAAFKRDPASYDRMRSILYASWGTVLPRSLPFRKSPCFVWLDSNWQPVVQELSYCLPLKWPLTGDTIDLAYTLHPFIQGMHGGDREPVRPVKWRDGIAYGSVFLPTAFLALLIALAPVGITNWISNFATSVTAQDSISQLPTLFNGQGSSAEPSLSNRPEEVSQATQSYYGKAIPYQFKVNSKWRPFSSGSDLPNLEYEFEHISGGRLEILSIPNQRMNEIYLDTFGAELKQEIEKLVRQKVPFATVEIKDDEWLQLNGVQWRAVSMIQNYSSILKEVRFSLYTTGPKGTVIVQTILPNKESSAQVRNELFANLSAAKSDIDELTEKAEIKSVHRGRQAAYSVSLPEAWVKIDHDKAIEEMGDIGKSIQEADGGMDIMFRLGNETKSASMELGVYEIEDGFEFKASEIVEADCLALFEERKQLLETVFPGMEIRTELLGYSVVKLNEIDWIEIRGTQSMKMRSVTRRIWTIERRTVRDGKMFIITCEIEKDHPQVRKMVQEAIESFRFLER